MSAGQGHRAQTVLVGVVHAARSHSAGGTQAARSHSVSTRRSSFRPSARRTGQGHCEWAAVGPPPARPASSPQPGPSCTAGPALLTCSLPTGAPWFDQDPANMHPLGPLRGWPVPKDWGLRNCGSGLARRKTGPRGGGHVGGAASPLPASHEGHPSLTAPGQL